MMAPVSVARSIMSCGLKRSRQYQSASASTRRPSASVLITSMVWPDIDFTTSPGRCAVPEGMFSTRPTTPTTLTLALRAASACISADDGAGTAHVPLHLLHAGGGLDGDAAGIEGDALADEGDRRLVAVAGAPCHCMTTSWDSRALPWPTPSSAFMPSSAICFSPRTSTFTPSSLSFFASGGQASRDR